MRVGVIGSGAIGPDLAYGFMSALAGNADARVYLLDIRQDALDGGVARIEGYIGKGLARGKLSAKAAEGMRKSLVPTLNMSDLADCSYVLEAASEDLKIKRAILTQLEQVVGADCLIGFATSGLPRAWIAAEARHPERCFVNHPFFPAWRSLPIEVVAGDDAALAARMNDTLVRLGKVPIPTADVVTFAADDIFCNYCSEAARLVAEGVATPAQIDAIVNGAIGGGGPLNVLDGTRGNLLVAHCQDLMQEARGEAGGWFAPPAILREKGNALWHDRKQPGDPSHDEKLHAVVLDRILAVLLARTYWVVENNVCDAADLNWMTRMALGFSTGLIDLAHQMGADEVRRVVVGYAEAHPGFEVPACVAEAKLPAFMGNVVAQTGDDGIALITVRRPEVKNALDARTLREIDAAMQAAEADKNVRGVIFTGFDGALAGADIGELAQVPGPAEAEALCNREHAIAARIEAMRKPVVAAIDGPVLGGGAELSMTCHARVVGPRLLMGQPEVNLGIVPGYGGTQRLPRLIGVARALDLMRTGRPVGAKDACAWGWAHGQPATDVIAAAKALIAAHLAGEAKVAPVDKAPIDVPEPLPACDIGHRSLAIDAILVDIVRRGLRRPLAEGLAIEAQGFGRCTKTVDMDIGMKNFIQNGPRVPAAFLHE
ncbi:MAG: 3-hydroxyacyl-CoA dehydrogenase/enoyl-CoA hydratase family protein [Myxococcales bacterium]|nr:3-hydroxyacyl-CoA dehydrogenase/enoyl-CoA hydratase family protein [Myxococcales bacterium]